MLPTEDLFVYVYVLIHDLIIAGLVAIPPRPGPAPGCSDAELLTIVMVRHLLRRRSEAGFLAEVAGDWPHLFPCLPHQSEANRRTRWLRGAFEQIRVTLAARLPEDDCQQIDTSALPVKHASRVRGPDGWTGPDGLHARFGRDAAHAEWFYGFRLAIKTDLGSRIVRAWSIVPAAVNERDVADDLLETGPPPRDLLVDKGFTGKAFTAGQAARGTAVLLPPAKGKTPPHAAGPAENHRRMAQPDRDHLQGDHRPDGTSPPWRAHLLGPAHPHRRGHRCPHPHASVPERSIDQPT
jgi:Transposase DDE domain